MNRIALAFLIASAMGTVVLLAPVLAESKDLAALLPIVGYGLLGVLPAAIAVGGPLLFLLKRFKLLKAWQFMLSGAGVWLIAIAIAHVLGAAPPSTGGIALSLAAMLISVAVFWLIAIRPKCLGVNA